MSRAVGRRTTGSSRRAADLVRAVRLGDVSAFVVLDTERRYLAGNVADIGDVQLRSVVDAKGTAYWFDRESIRFAGSPGTFVVDPQAACEPPSRPVCVGDRGARFVGGTSGVAIVGSMGEDRTHLGARWISPSGELLQRALTSVSLDYRRRIFGAASASNGDVVVGIEGTSHEGTSPSRSAVSLPTARDASRSEPKAATSRGARSSASGTAQRRARTSGRRRCMRPSTRPWGSSRSRSAPGFRRARATRTLTPPRSASPST